MAGPLIAMAPPADETPEPYTPKIDRRAALAWVVLAGGAIAISGPAIVAYRKSHHGPAALAKGYGTDPKLVTPAKAAWPRILTKDELTTAAVLADFILPASGGAPSASALGV